MENYRMNSTQIKIRALKQGEQIPYEILLLSDDTKKSIDTNLDKGELYVGEFEGKIIGAFILKQIQPATIEIKNIAVVENEQGKGIGTVFLDYIINESRARELSLLIVGTCDQCFKEIEFYRKSGFRIFSIRKDFFLRNYDQPIYENGIQIRDMIMLSIDLNPNGKDH